MSEPSHLPLDRRQLLTGAGRLLGGVALSGLANARGEAPLHFAPRAKRVVYLFQSGGPSTVDLFDFKPVMRKLHGTELPDSVRGGQRVTGMTAG